MATRSSNGSLPLQWAVAARTCPGQAVSGDAYVVKPFAAGVLLAVVDGLGQSNRAAAAAQSAVAVLSKYAADSIVSLIKRCHRNLMMTRGAVMALAAIDPQANLTWLGIGNVEGVILRANAAAIPSLERLRPHGGVVGYQLPILRAQKTNLRPDDLLILATDGISGDFVVDLPREGSPQRIANRIMERYWKGNDDGLVLAVRYVGTGHE